MLVVMPELVGETVLSVDGRAEREVVALAEEVTDATVLSLSMTKNPE